MAHQIVFSQAHQPLQPYYSKGLRERFKLGENQTPTEGDNTQIYADIEYRPDEAKYLARAQHRVRAGGLEKDVPDGFPRAQVGPLFWTGTELKDETDFVHHLTASHRIEIDQALFDFKSNPVDAPLH